MIFANSQLYLCKRCAGVIAALEEVNYVVNRIFKNNLSSTREFLRGNSIIRSITPSGEGICKQILTSRKF